MALPVFGGISGSNSTTWNMRKRGAALRLGGTTVARQNHALGRIVEFDAQAPKFIDDAKIHGLLQIEQRIQIGLLHEIREFEVQSGIAEGLQMATLETGVLLLAGRPVGAANGRQRALFLGAAEIPHAALQDIGVGENDLLAALAAQAG